MGFCLILGKNFLTKKTSSYAAFFHIVYWMQQPILKVRVLRLIKKSFSSLDYLLLMLFENQTQSG